MSTETATDPDGMLEASAAANVLDSIDHRLADWSTFRKHLSTRKKPIPLRKRLTPHAIAWGLPSDHIADMALTMELFGLRKQRSKSSTTDWSEQANRFVELTHESELGRDLALASLAWCHGMPNLAKRLPQDLWRDVCRSLLHMPASNRLLPQDEIVNLQVRCELPMTLAYIFRDIHACTDYVRVARTAFAATLDRVLDGEGMPPASQLADVQTLLASSIRILTMDSAIKKGRVDKTSRLQFDWMVRQTLRWSRSDGSTILSHHRSAPYFDELMKAALAYTGDASDATAMKMLRGKRKTPAKVSETPDASEHSEWSEIATMRSDWSPSQSRLAVDFSQNKLRIELAAQESTLLLGESSPEIQINGNALTTTSEWEEVCWESDHDMDYIELENVLSSGWKIQRQILLARPDNFLFMADAILGNSNGLIEYVHELPLADGIVAQQADDTQEVHLIAGKRVATAVPLSMSEWKTGSRDGKFTDHPLSVSIRHRGNGLYVPLFIDLDTNRLRRALTWRQLTVGQDLQIVPHDVASAYRIHIGKQQWVFYRSLAPAENRTFLGVNLISEFLAARFLKDGETEPLVDIAG